MTKEELTGEALDAEVAKAMGLKVERCAGLDFSYGYASEDPSYCRNCGSVVFDDDVAAHGHPFWTMQKSESPVLGVQLFRTRIPRFSSNPAAAAEVRRWLQQRREFYAEYHADGSVSFGSDHTMSHHTHASTESEATARFILRLVEEGLIR